MDIETSLKQQQNKSTLTKYNVNCQRVIPNLPFDKITHEHISHLQDIKLDESDTGTWIYYGWVNFSWSSISSNFSTIWHIRRTSAHFS